MWYPPYQWTRSFVLLGSRPCSGWLGAEASRDQRSVETWHYDAWRSSRCLLILRVNDSYSKAAGRVSFQILLGKHYAKGCDVETAECTCWAGVDRSWFLWKTSLCPRSMWIWSSLVESSQYDDWPGLVQHHRQVSVAEGCLQDLCLRSCMGHHLSSIIIWETRYSDSKDMFSLLYSHFVNLGFQHASVWVGHWCRCLCQKRFCHSSR